jgi:hypothetical protein
MLFDYFKDLQREFVVLYSNLGEDYIESLLFFQARWAMLSLTRIWY